MTSMPDSLGSTLPAQQFHPSSRAMTSALVGASLQSNRQYSVLKLISRAWSAHCFNGHWKEKRSTFFGSTRFLVSISCPWLHRQLSANWDVEVSKETYVASADPHRGGSRNHSSCQSSHNSEERMQVSSKKCLSRPRQHNY